MPRYCQHSLFGFLAVTTTASSPKRHLPFFPVRLSDGGLAGQEQSSDPTHRRDAPPLARAPRPSEGCDVTASLYWPQSMSVRSSALEVRRRSQIAVTGRLVPFGICDWCAEGRRTAFLSADWPGLPSVRGKRLSFSFWPTAGVKFSRISS